MKKIIIGAVLASGLILSSIASGNDEKVNTESVQVHNVSETKDRKIAEKVSPTCDGTAVTADCIFEGVVYKTYVYHPAVPEKTHTETLTTYKEEVTGYCTLCADGTYSPSCATGRGACSHHGGVAQWNAPVYAKVPEYKTQTIIDSPAIDEYYEKVPE